MGAPRITRGWWITARVDIRWVKTSVLATELFPIVKCVCVGGGGAEGRSTGAGGTRKGSVRGSKGGGLVGLLEDQRALSE